MRVLRIILLILALIVMTWLFIAIVSIASHKDKIPRNPVVQEPAMSVQTITINGHVFKIQLANTPQKRTDGLSETPPLLDDSGMLFVFDAPGKYDFWMHKMNYPLDFVWINGNEVVQINQNIPAPIGGTPIITISPTTDVDKVLEINAGTIQKYGIAVSDNVKINY